MYRFSNGRRNIIIVGNGFDLSVGFNTSYGDFNELLLL